MSKKSCTKLGQRQTGLVRRPKTPDCRTGTAGREGGQPGRLAGEVDRQAGEVGRLGRWTGRQATWGTQWPAARVVRAGKPVGRARFFSYCCLPVAAAAAAFPTHSKSV